MAGETPTGNSGWTIETYSAHNEALRQAQERFEAERDRRYHDVALEKEKALRIKEEADKAALLLAREIQTYKDEKANELREQINSERGLYATKADVIAATEKLEATIKPLLDFMASQAGQRTGTLDTRTLVFALIGAAGVIAGVIAVISR
jgi:hypothetical protein